MLARPAILFSIGLVLAFLVFTQTKDDNQRLQVLAAQVSREEELVKLTEMKKYWENVVYHFPTYRDGFLQLAVIHHRMDNLAASRQALRQVVLLDPNFQFPTQLSFLLPLLSQ